MPVNTQAFSGFNAPYPVPSFDLDDECDNGKQWGRGSLRRH
jgi:hypothetical protein